MEEHEDDRDLGAFVGEAVGIARAVALDQRMGAHLAQVVSELVQAISLGRESEAREEHLVELQRRPAPDRGAGMQQNLHEANHARIVDLDAGILGAAHDNRKGQALQEWEVDVRIQAARLEGGEAFGDAEELRAHVGKQWYFGMKLHIGMDSQHGLAHSAVVTAANVYDKHALPQLLHGGEQEVYGDSAYASQQALIASKAANAEDRTNQRVVGSGVIADLERIVNRIKSKVRSRVERVFAVVKRQFGFAKVRYRGLAKNVTRAFVTLSLANIYLARGCLGG